MLKPHVLCVVVVSVASLAAQAPAAPSFDVATIKPTDPDYRAKFVNSPAPGVITFQGYTTADLIAFAFDADARIVAGVPKGLEPQTYDITAKSDAIQNPARPEVRQTARTMLLTLLAQRFRLAVHRETRQVPIYALRTVKGGHRMKARSEGDGGEAISVVFRGNTLPGRNAPMFVLATTLQRLVDRPVKDDTGLTGNFDFDLSWRPVDATGRATVTDVDEPDLFTALQEQLGLKLDAETGPGEIIVVDRVEAPSPN